MFLLHSSTVEPEITEKISTSSGIRKQCHLRLLAPTRVRLYYELWDNSNFNTLRCVRQRYYASSGERGVSGLLIEHLMSATYIRICGMPVTWISCYLVNVQIRSEVKEAPHEEQQHVILLSTRAILHSKRSVVYKVSYAILMRQGIEKICLFYIYSWAAISPIFSAP